MAWHKVRRHIVRRTPVNLSWRWYCLTCDKGGPR